MNTQHYKKHHFNYITLVLLLLMIPLAQAAKDPKLIPHWIINNPLSTQKINHTIFQNFLNNNIKTYQQYTYVNYSKVSTQDKRNLAKYINYLTSIKITNYNRQQQLAYWINLYNSLTIQLVLKNYPISSITEVKATNGIGSLLSRGPWGNKLITIENRSLSLDDIEHSIIRPIWSDPRTHYALNCASYSCPKLQAKAFSATKLTQQLNRAAREYVNNKRGVNLQNGRLTVSSIYKWFQIDFGNTEAGVLKHLMIYAAPDLRKQLKRISSINKYDYNWQLNDSKLIQK